LGIAQLAHFSYKSYAGVCTYADYLLLLYKLDLSRNPIGNMGKSKQRALIYQGLATLPMKAAQSHVWQ
jgi:hypothetical protein